MKALRALFVPEALEEIASSAKVDGALAEGGDDRRDSHDSTLQSRADSFSGLYTEFSHRESLRTNRSIASAPSRNIASWAARYGFGWIVQFGKCVCEGVAPHSGHSAV